MKTLLAALVAVFLCLPVNAQELVCPVPITTVVEAYSEQGGEILEIVKIHGVGYDTLVLVDFDEQLVAVFGRGGCAIGRPFAVARTMQAVPA